MEDFKVNFKNGRKELKIEVTGIEGKEDLLFIQDVLNSFNISMKNLSDSFTEDEPLKVESEDSQKIEAIKKGYAYGANDIKGIHSPESEFTPPGELPKSEPSVRKGVMNSAMEEAFKKAQSKKESNGQKESSPIEPASLPQHKPYTLKYQAFYVCPECQNKGKRRVPEDATEIECHNCSEKMPLRLATDEGLPAKDIFGNQFIAGTFVKATPEKAYK